MGAPWNDGDTGVVSTVGTPMLKSARKLMSASHRSGCLGRPGRVGYLGYLAVSGRVPWASPVKGQQCPSEWLAAGGDLTGDRSRWVASAAVPRVLGFDRESFKICSAEWAPRTRQAEKATRKSDQSGKVYRCTVPSICWSERVGHQQVR
ncbi:hypothetical protein TIFTF001_025580 [Ficus carica]|uniref:Uncharacterized protein n=1 Tax=Ficus carica TaxID=3494 RepID=A0AA88DFN4_FICCA|nr:hypothetical protein TIFTF001_025580 [Ficus carica]